MTDPAVTVLRRRRALLLLLGLSALAWLLIGAVIVSVLKLV